MQCSSQELFSTAIEFCKLEKVEIGGIKGKMLSHQVVEIFEEFTEYFAVFGNRTYDGLDATNKVCIVPFYTRTIFGDVKIKLNSFLTLPTRTKNSFAGAGFKLAPRPV